MKFGKISLLSPSVLYGLVGASVVSAVWSRLSSNDLSGKVAVIGGGSRGLGFLIARELANEGCKIVIAARDETELSRAKEKLEERGTSVTTVTADLSNKEDGERLVATACETYGGIDILINNAGVIQVAPFDSTSEEDFREAMDLMFWGPLHTTCAALPSLKERQGSIVNITSMGGMVSFPHLLPYSAAKFAAVGLSQGLHAELKRHKVSVTTVAPGTMRTGSHVQAWFGGNASKEYRWFKLAASLPFLSTDAENAAAQIVKALKHRAPFLVIGIPARIGVRMAGLFPGLTAVVLAGVNRLLPEPPPTQRTHVRGKQVEREGEKENLGMRSATVLGDRSVRQFQELNAT